MGKRFRTLILCSCLLMVNISLACAYDYPFTDRYVATILGTPDEFAAPVPEEIPVKIGTLQMFPEREVPGILWNLTDLYYSTVLQAKPAPLVFLIAGTGASFNSSKMQAMQKQFYQAGYHVVSISSPTVANFIVAASTSGVPGDLVEDSADIYRVMEKIWQKLEKKIEVTGFYVTGYSLGAAQTAYVAHLDEQKKVFNFKKALMINPPLSLYNSVRILDDMLEQNIPGGLDHFNDFYQSAIDAFADVYAHGDNVDFNDQFLYKAYQYRKPKSEDRLKALIGVDFRLSSENMVFASDVMTKAGYVVSRDVNLGRFDIPTNYIKVLGRLTFVDYFKGLFLPHFQAQNPKLTEAEMIKRISLYPIEDYLRTSPKIGLIHNEDDIIMQPGEVDILRQMLGKRAFIFPLGGHCGNMSYPENVAAMLDFFQASKN